MAGALGSGSPRFSAPVKPIAKAAAAAATVRLRNDAAITPLTCAPSATLLRLVIAGAPVLWLIRRIRGYRKGEALAQFEIQITENRQPPISGPWPSSAQSRKYSSPTR